MGSNPSYFSSRNNYAENLQRPVEYVTWDDCQTFIAKLNQLTGKNFRLPTEAEWEYAARGGKLSQGYEYAGSNNVDDVAWCSDNIPSHTGGSETHGTQTVASKAPNELGLYDMSGNVWEWCQDWYGDYTSGEQKNPTGPASGFGRVIRGGCWYGNAPYCRVLIRRPYVPLSASNNVGLRLVL
jgi:formylglycine-generating enzyme required for sulfatase activity